MWALYDTARACCCCHARLRQVLTRAAAGCRRFAVGVLVTYIVFVALYSYVGLRSFKS